MKTFVTRTLFRALALAGGFKSLAWVYGVDDKITPYLATHRLLTTAVFIIALIWIHLVWDADRSKLMLAYHLRTKGALRRLKKPPNDPELPFEKDD